MRQQYKYDIWPLKFESIIAYLMLLGNTVLVAKIVLSMLHKIKNMIFDDKFVVEI